MEEQNHNLNGFKYDAFISYRHAELDIYAAEHLHKLLENFKVPRLAEHELKKRQKRRINRVFRDKDELPASDNLAEPIEEALKNSQFLIVICSPRTPESKWVSKEIEQFAKCRGRENILAVLIEGEPNESFPQVMCHGERQITRDDGTVDTEDYEIEPLAADVRGVSKIAVYRNLKREVLRLAAPILHCSYDDLKQRHKEQKLKKTLSIASVIGTAVLVFGCFMTAQNMQIRKLQSESLATQAATAYQQGDRQKGLQLINQALDARYTTQAQTELTDLLQVYENGENYLPEMACRHDIQVTGMAANEDCSLIASIDKMSQVYVWDVASGALLYKGATLTDQVIPETLVFIDDQKFIYSAVGGIVEFDTMKMDSHFVVEDIYANSITLSERHGYLVVTDRYSVNVYDTATWELKKSQFADETGKYTVTGGLQVTDDGRYFSYGMTDLSTTSLYTVIDTRTGDILYQSKLPYDWIGYARLESDGSSYVLSKDFAATGSFLLVGKEQMIHFDATGREKWNYEENMLMNLPIERDQEDIVFASNCDLIFLNAQSGKEHLRIGYSATIRNFKLFDDHIDCYLKDGTVFRAKWEKDHYETEQIMTSSVKRATEYAYGSNHIAICPEDDICIYLYRKEMADNAISYEPLPSYVSDVIENRKQNRILVQGLASNEMLLIDIKDKESKAIHLPHGDDEVVNLITNAYDEKAFVAVTNNHIRTYSWDDGDLLKETVVGEYITQQSVSGDGKVLCIQAFDTLYTMSLASDSDMELQKMKQPKQPIYHFYLNGDGTGIYGTDAENQGVCFDTITGETETLEWNSNHLAYNGNASQYLIANSNSECIELYDEKNQVTASARADISLIKNIGFSKDGAYIYVQKLDGTFEIYSSSKLKPIKTIIGVETSVGRMEPVAKLGWALYSDEAYGDTGYLCNQDMEVIGRIPKLFSISADGKTLYTANKENALSIKLRSLRDLKKSAKMKEQSANENTGKR